MLVYSQVSQSRQEERDASSWRQARKNVCLLVMIGSGFTCDWVKKIAIDISANLKARKRVFTHITSGYVIKRLHKKTGQLPQDCPVAWLWPPFIAFGTPTWPTWRCLKTLYNNWWNRGTTEGVICQGDPNPLEGELLYLTSWNAEREVAASTPEGLKIIEDESTAFALRTAWTSHGPDDHILMAVPSSVGIKKKLSAYLELSSAYTDT